MNKREVNIELTLNKLNVTGNEEIPQGDKNTHFLNLKFDDTLDLSGYQLIVMYGLPYPSKQTLVDAYDNVSNVMNILIPNNALKINGNVAIEFALKKGEELITVNKTMIVKVISSLNLTSLEVIPSGKLNETIDEKVENIKKLLEQSEIQINNYVNDIAKPNIDNYVNTNSKTKIDDYVLGKEKELSGATYTPTVSENGDLSWANNKGLPNPPVVNIKGPKGEPGTGGGGSGEIDTSNLLKKGTLPKEIETAEDLLSLMEKKTGATFNRNLLYLNDKGVKEEGKLYFDRNKQGIYKCKKTTTADYVVNSTDYFVDISNLENANKLENLHGYKLIKEFESSEFNKEIKVIDLIEIGRLVNKKGFCLYQIIVFASTEHYSVKEYCDITLLKFTVPNMLNNNIQPIELQTTKYMKAEVELRYDASTSAVFANLKNKKTKIKVYVLRIEASFKEFTPIFY